MAACECVRKRRPISMISSAKALENADMLIDAREWLSKCSHREREKERESRLSSCVFEPGFDLGHLL